MSDQLILPQQMLLGKSGRTPSSELEWLFGPPVVVTVSGYPTGCDVLKQNPFGNRQDIRQIF